MQYLMQKTIEVHTNVLLGHCFSADLMEESLATNENQRDNFGYVIDDQFCLPSDNYHSNYAV